MISRRHFLVSGAGLAGLRVTSGADAPATSNLKPAETSRGRELIRDPRFQAGFRLIEPKPGQRVAYGRLDGFPGAGDPAWDLDQWSSRFPLAAAQPVSAQAGVRTWRNAAKTVTLGTTGAREADLALGVNASLEYDNRARKAAEPWVHLLVEQSFLNPPSLGALRSARLRLQALLLRSEHHRTDDYSPGLHAAQFQMFLTVQNQNRRSAGFGQLVWFGIPLYDDRSRFPREHKAQDTGGTGMFIFTPAGEAFTDRSAHDRDWVRVDKELRPLLVEAVESAWRSGFLRDSRDLADYRITTTNIGWEVPGLFDVELRIRDVSLWVVED